MKYCFGVDIGGTTVKMGLFQEDGKLLDNWEIPTKTQEEGKAILPDIAQSMEEKLKEKKIAKEEVTGVGVGVPAPVTKDGIVTKTANLGWGYKEVKRELEELTGLKADIGNDANVAALGEMWKGGGVGSENLIMVTLGTGVGGGIIVEGKILTGQNGAGAEIGHLCVNPHETDVCGCGKKGCLEQYASATGIVRIGKQILEKNTRDTVLKMDGLSAKDIFDAVKEKDEVAMDIAEKFGKYLGHAMANIAVIVDPDIVVIGGGVSKAGEILLEYIQKYYEEKVFFANKKVKFVLAELGNDAGIYGAAKLALD